jgi:hypothetical protein
MSQWIASPLGKSAFFFNWFGISSLGRGDWYGIQLSGAWSRAAVRIT